MQTKLISSILVAISILGSSLLNCVPVIAQDINIQTEQTAQIFLPLIQGSNSLGADNTAWLQEATPTTTFYSSYFGLSLDYPSNWTVEEPDPTQFKQPQFPNKPYGYRVNLFPPGEGPQSKYFELGYYRVEISAGQSLIDFVQKKVYHESLLMGLPRKLTDTTIISLESESGSAVDMVIGSVETTAGATTYTSRGAFFAHGHLVYLLYTADSAYSAALEEIAKTLAFSKDAPTTLDELHGENLSGKRRTIEEQIAELEQPDDPNYCDIACQDSKNELSSLPADIRVSDESTTVVSNHQYENQNQSSFAPSIISTVPITRYSLPANWYIPTRINTTVECGSGYHVGNAAYAADIGVTLNSTVYAAKQGTVTDAGWAGAAPSYGNYVVIQTSVNIAAESRQYIHGYAHLNSDSVDIGNTVSDGTVIGASGCTGTNPCAPHLHFHVSKLNGTRGPVDLTPMVGFTPDLNYPDQYATCGAVVNSIPNGNYPLILESVGFTQRSAGGGFSWFCFMGGHTVECRLTASPNNGTIWEPTLPTSNFNSTARADYSNVFVPVTGSYYVWVCGKGGTGDDSVHLGSENQLGSSAAKLTGFTTGWSWKSVKVDNTRPSIYLFSSIGGSTLNDRIINMLMRHDGFMYDRVLLTSSSTYDPNNHIRCGGY